MLNLKASLYTDYNKRNNYKNIEIPLITLKLLSINKIIALDKRAKLGINLFSNKNSLSKIKNRCLISGRSKAILNKYKLSRIKFKNFANLGLLAGIRKSSW